MLAFKWSYVPLCLGFGHLVFHNTLKTALFLWKGPRQPTNKPTNQPTFTNDQI